MNNLRRASKYLLFYPILAILFLELFLQIAALTLKVSGREKQDTWNTKHIKVLAIGDSNTYGLYLDQELSWPSQLQAMWNNSQQQQIEILNFGYPGTNTYRVLDTYEALLTELKPEYVLLMIGVNDYLNPYQGKNKQAAEEANSLVKTLLNKSRLYKFFGLINDSQFDSDKVDAGNRIEFTPGKDKNKTKMAIHQWKQSRVEGENNDEYIYFGDKKFKVNGHIAGKKPDKKLIKVKENILEIANLSEKFDTKLILLTYPASQWFYQPANQQIRLAASESRLPLIDIANQFKTFCPRSLECPDVFFAPYDLHPRASGYKIAAETVMQEMLEIIE